MDIIIRKLISYIDLMDKGIEILQLENIKFGNSVVDKRAKKKKKWAVLFTESVFTTKQAKAFINTKEAVKEAKQRIKKERKDIAIIAKV